MKAIASCLNSTTRLSHRLRGVLCLWSMMAATLVMGQSFSLEASKRVVKVGDPFQIFVRIENMPGARVEFPSFGGLQKLGGEVENRQQSFDSRTGKLYEVVAYSFMVRATKSGSFTIKPASIKVGSKTYKTQSLTITAKPNPGWNTNQRKRAESSGVDPSVMAEVKKSLFVRGISSKPEVYQGEQVAISYKVYNNIGGNPSPAKEALPKFEGFWMEEMKLPPIHRPKQETYKGRTYNTYFYRQFVVFPQKTGRISIDSLSLWFKLQLTDPSAPSNDPFDDMLKSDPFLQDFFRGTMRRSGQPFVYQTSSAPIQLFVKPLPPQAPESFSGLVGSLKLTASIDQRTIETGEALTVIVRLEGQGNMKQLIAPKLSFPQQAFEVYDPNVKERIFKEGGIVQGVKQFEYLVVPKIPGNYSLSPTEVSYFDPEAERYISLEADEISLKVTGEPQYGTQPLHNSSGTQEGPRPIHLTQSAMQAKPDFAGSPLFWVLFGSPILLLGAMMIWRRARHQRAADVVGNRVRQATQMAQKRLKQADMHRQAGQAKAFYDEVVRALWGYLGDKLNMAQSNLSRDQVRAELSNKSVPLALQDRVVNLLDECEMALFAPAAIGQQMEPVYQSALDLLADLEDHLKGTVTH